MSITAEKLQQVGYKLTKNNNYIKQNTGVYLRWIFENGDELTKIMHGDEVSHKVTTETVNDCIEYLKENVVEVTANHLNSLEFVGISKGNVVGCEVGSLELLILFRKNEDGTYERSELSHGKKVKYHEFSLRSEREVKVTVEVVE